MTVQRARRCECAGECAGRRRRDASDRRVRHTRLTGDLTDVRHLVAHADAAGHKAPTGQAGIRVHVKSRVHVAHITEIGRRLHDIERGRRECRRIEILEAANLIAPAIGQLRIHGRRDAVGAVAGRRRLSCVLGGDEVTE